MLRFGAVLVFVAWCGLASGCGAARASETDATGVAITGRPFALAVDGLQRPTLLVFWASWCAPCRAEAPQLLELEHHYTGRLDVIGINVDEKRADAVAFAEHVGIDYPSAHDPELTISDGFGVGGVPTLILLGASGAEWARASSIGELEATISCRLDGLRCP